MKRLSSTAKSTARSTARHHLLFLGLAAAFGSPESWAVPPIKGRLRSILGVEAQYSETTKENEEWPGTRSVAITKEPELNVRIWEDEKKYALEFVVDTTQGNHEILDVHNNVINEDGLGPNGVSFFWAQLENHDRVSIDMVCESMRNACTGRWKNFPYRPGTRQKLRVFSSMSGFKKREWPVELESAVPENIPPGSMPGSVVLKSAHGKLPGGDVHQTILFNKEVYKNPFSDLQYSPIRIDQWNVKKGPGNTGIGLHRVARTLLFEVVGGVARIEVLTGKQYSIFEVRSGERLWTPPEAAIAIKTSGGKGEDSAVIRRVEFP
jgi:hypothetical protein